MPHATADERPRLLLCEPYEDDSNPPPEEAQSRDYSLFFERFLKPADNDAIILEGLTPLSVTPATRDRLEYRYSPADAELLRQRYWSVEEMARFDNYIDPVEQELLDARELIHKWVAEERAEEERAEREGQANSNT